jgi:hypothetical protein
MPVREMLQRIDSYELTEWVVYFKLEEKERDREMKVQEAEAKASSQRLPPGMG